KKGLRDRAMLAILLGCGLRRAEVAALTLKHIQQRDNRWCIVDLVGKHGRGRTIPMPTWVKVATEAWTTAAGGADGYVFRPVNRAGQVQVGGLGVRRSRAATIEGGCMNRPLPPGDRGRGIATPRRASRRAGTVPGAGGLVAGTAAAASDPRIGHRCATLGPRLLQWGWLGVSANAAVTTGRGRVSRPEAKKPATPLPGGPERRRSMLLVDPIGSLAALRFEGLDSVSGLFHRVGHKPAHGVLLPAHFLHDLRERGAVLSGAWRPPAPSCCPHEAPIQPSPVSRPF